ncbi:MAG: ORF6N domain-containing protein [Erysipelotrichaceae bacterium]|nr:ORF6N domain-containing protein [Erysipelotrichaceae bacterium]
MTNKTAKIEDSRVVLIDEQRIKDKIYTIRGVQIMFDFDLAEMYGYEVRALNQQVKRNIERFPANFMFQLTKDETELVKSQFVTSPTKGFFEGQEGGRRKLPLAFTEQGAVMLASVLRTPRAVEISVRIVEAFVEMTHYMNQSRQIAASREMYLLSRRQDAIEADVKEISNTINNKLVSKDELPLLIQAFSDAAGNEEILIANGKPLKADEAFQSIYKKAKKNIIIVDDYISVKTLTHLAASKGSVNLTIITDNKARPRLRLSDYNDFQAESTGRTISFIQNQRQFHDRYILLDYGEANPLLYHCGIGAKDAGNKVTSITKLADIKDCKALIGSALSNPALTLT